MISRTNNISEHAFIAVYLISIALFYTVLGLQGFDMCDEGWVLSGYQQIFNDPESVQYLFLYYLSIYTGGLWESVFGGLGILGYRLLAMICITASSYIVYRVLRPYINRWCIMAGMFWVFSCAEYGIMVFYHDYLTTLMSLAASAFLLKSLLGNNYKLILISGFIIGVNVFVRLPNLSLILLIFTLIPYYIYNRDIFDTKLMLSYAALGFLGGVIIILLLITVSGHTNVFINCIEDGLSAVGDNSSTHNLPEMGMIYLRNYAMVVFNILCITIFPAVVARYGNIITNRAVRFLSIAAVTVIYILILRLTAQNTITLYAACTACCILTLVYRRKNKEYVYMACIILINMYALPLGSDYGIENMGEYCVWLSGPFTVGMTWQWWRGYANNNKFSKITIAACITVLTLFILKRGVGNIYGQCYFDEGCRHEKTYLIDNSLATTYTTRKNCEQLNPLLHELSRYVKEGDVMLCFQNIATVHYLTKTRPYLRNPWVWTYDTDNMRRKFEEAENKYPLLPVVVRDKSMLPKWYEYYPDWNNEHAAESYTHKNGKISLINNFLSRHQYKVVWENEVFQILLSE